MSNLLTDHFAIRVKIFKASDLPHPNISSLICVQIGSNKKYTSTVTNTDKPFYNEYFVFDLSMDFSTLMSIIITIAMFQPRRAYKYKRLIGCISLDMATVWSHRDHQLKKWLSLFLPSDPTGKPMALVQCEIIIETPERYKIQYQLSPVESPDVIGGMRARYKVQLYRCIGLEIEGSKKITSQVSIRVSFAGNSKSTTKRPLQQWPEWNEQITFIEFFPPLFQKITVDIIIGKKLLASKHFYLSQFSNVSTDGYLPTLGPTYIHFYTNGYIYRASLSLSIQTELISLFRFDERFHGVAIDSIRPLPKESCGSVEGFLCYGVLFDVALVNTDYSYKDVRVCISFGSTGRKMLKDSQNNTSTLAYNTVRRSKHFAYLPLEENKPCVFIRSEEPNNLHRLFNMNLLSKAADNLRGRIDYAKELSLKGNEGEAKVLLNESLQKLKSDCEVVSKQFSMGITQLDKDRMRFILKQLTSIKSTTFIGGMNFQALLEKSKQLLSILDMVCDDVQDSLPNLIVVLKSAKKTIGFSVVLPNKIIFSHSELRKGHGSGKINYLVLNDESNNYVGRLDIWLWLGFWKQVGQCLRALPPGHEDISKMVTLPLKLTFTANKFTVVCRIYGGRIADGLDHEGLCDSFVTVMFSTRSQRTSTKKRSLVPLWKETLVLEELDLYHSPVYIQQNPPPISLYLWDETPKETRLLGTASVIPVVRLQPFSSVIDYNLQWTKLSNLSEILAAFEIIQISNGSESPDKFRMSTIIPKFIDPPTASFKLEVVFWGIRSSYFGCLGIVNRPQAIIQFGTTELKSNIITNLKSFPNFGHNLLVTQVEVPETKLYSPPLLIRVTASVKFIGSGVENNAHLYTIQLPTKNQWDDLTAHRKSLVDRAEARRSLSRDSMPDLIPLIEIDEYSRASSLISQQKRFMKSPVAFFRSLKSWLIYLKSFLYTVEKKVEKILDDDKNDEDHDWWYKYFSGILAKYTNKLEDQKEYGGFNDVLRTFTITRKTAEFEREVAKLKVLISLYRWPVQDNVVTPRGEDPTMGVLKQNELSDRVKLLVRVYCVKAFDLHPADPNGKADPYIEVATPSNVVSDKLNYVPNQLNPVFGRCLEIAATFPVDTMLAIRVMDWDRLTKHDLIGETIIDLENRFYSKHRGTCGLASKYSTSGCNSWRDVEKPTEILERLCNTYNLPLPQYYSKSVLVACKEFVITDVSENAEETKERLALKALHHWHELPVIGKHLVTEHVETRSLFKREKPGLEQGKLELWVDLFDLSMGQIPLPINITPRKPQSYELRVVILNTSQVPLVDDSYFVGRKSTDIFVKGWLWDSNDVQMTDVHYNSINGEGNFNWRFIFQFQYYRSEKVMIFYKKRVWDLATTEVKVPPLLHLQVWDRDRLSSDDFIGDMVIELNKMPRGARSVKTCKLRTPLTPFQGVDLFKVKRMRGWWPFIREKTDKTPTYGGFLEAEFHLMTDEEALARPAGMGRSEPMALPPPMRPEFRTKFWLAPFRILTHLICKVHRKKFIFGLLICASTLFVLVGVYSIPMFVMKKLLGAK